MELNFIERIRLIDLNNIIQNRGASSSLLAILLLLLAWQGWTITQLMRTTAVEPVTMAQGTIDTEVVVMSDLADLHLFGIPTDNIVLAPETRLGLQLKSIFLSTMDGASSVLIAVGEETKSYVVGDILAGNAVIEEILSDRIVIRYNGQLETLSLQRQYPDLNQRFSE